MSYHSDRTILYHINEYFNEGKLIYNSVYEVKDDGPDALLAARCG